MPMQRASSTSVGLRSTGPVGAEHDRQLAGRRRGSARSGRARTRSLLGSSRWCGWPLRVEKILQPQHVALSAPPTMIGPPAPLCNRRTRRRIRARMIRSPSSASSTRRSRSREGGMTSASTGSFAIPSTRDGLPDSCASSPMKEPGPWVTINSGSSWRLRCVISTRPERRTKAPAATSPVVKIRVPAA